MEYKWICLAVAIAILQGCNGQYYPQWSSNKHHDAAIGVSRYTDPETRTLIKRATDPQFVFQQVKTIMKEDNPHNISEECLKHIDTIGAGTVRRYEWALLIGDSNGKEQSGIWWGAVNWLGSYEQCVSVKATGQKWTTIGGVTHVHDFDARYCRTWWFSEVFYSLGVCYPESCSTTDVHKILRFNHFLPVLHTYCEEKESLSDKPESIVAIIVLSAFGALVLIATLVDYKIQLTLNTKKQSNKDNTREGNAVGTSNRAFQNDQAINVISSGPVHAVENAYEIVEAVKKEENEIREGHGVVQGGVKATGNIDNGSVYSTENVYETVGENNGEGRQCDSDATIQKTSSHDTTKEYKPGKTQQALLSFSLYKTIPKVMSTKRPPGAYYCMDGIRFLTMAWIIMGHVSQLGIWVLATPQDYVTENQWGQWQTIYSHWHTAALMEMSNSVESFFVLSASLVTVAFMKNLARQSDRPTIRQIALYYFHRYWRLTPVLAIVIMFAACIFPLLRYGPMFPEYFVEFETCSKSWWTNLLYVNNFFILDSPCVSWTWYLANDFQFYCIAPLFIILLYKWPIPGWLFLIAGYCGQLVASVYINSEIVFEDTTGTAWHIHYYIKPWCRFGSYAIGMGLGAILYKTKDNKVKIPKVLVLLGWTCCAFLLLSSIYVTPNREFGTKAEWVAHESTKRDTFALGMAWFVFACVNGYGGVFNTILSWRGFTPLSRLTYIGYLIHVIILYYFYFTNMRMIYVTFTNIIIYTGGIIFYTVLASLVLTLVFEVPLLALEKVFIPPPKQNNNKSKNSYDLTHASQL